jgi:hypothetical protein
MDTPDLNDAAGRPPASIGPCGCAWRTVVVLAIVILANIAFGSWYFTNTSTSCSARPVRPFHREVPPCSTDRGAGPIASLPPSAC